MILYLCKQIPNVQLLQIQLTADEASRRNRHYRAHRNIFRHIK